MDLKTFFTNFVLRTISIIFLHEFSHLFILLLLGGQGFISINAFGLFTEATTAPSFPYGMEIVAFGGGILASAFCLLLWYFEESKSDKFIWRVNGWVQFSYGLVEGLMYNNEFLWEYNQIFLSIAVLIPMIYCFVTTKKNILEEKMKK